MQHRPHVLHPRGQKVPFHELSAQADGTSSAVMREQVSKARAVQRQRFGPETHTLNSRMTTRQLRRHCALDEEGKALLKAAMDEVGLSARAHDRILRVARTLADLDGGGPIRPAHVVEAISYRSLDRKAVGAVKGDRSNRTAVSRTAPPGAASPTPLEGVSPGVIPARAATARHSATPRRTATAHRQSSTVKK